MSSQAQQQPRTVLHSDPGLDAAADALLVHLARPVAHTVAVATR